MDSLSSSPLPPPCLTVRSVEVSVTIGLVNSLSTGDLDMKVIARYPDSLLVVNDEIGAIAVEAEVVAGGGMIDLR